MSMIKTGVCQGENEAPVVKEAAKKCPDCGHAPGERGNGNEPQKSCGTDLMSKMADEVAAKK